MCYAIEIMHLFILYFSFNILEIKNWNFKKHKHRIAFLLIRITEMCWRINKIFLFSYNKKTVRFKIKINF